MKAAIDVSIAVPAYQEEENLRVLLPRLKVALDSSGLAWEILVIDTESPMDGTKAVADSCGAVYCPRTGGNRYGDAVRTGFGRARGESIIFMDADGSHTPEFCLELLKHRSEADVVIASRYVAGGATDNSKSLILMSRVVNTVYSLVLGLKCKDVSNSFRLYRSSSVAGIELRSQNFDIVEEVLFKIGRRDRDARFLEVPFTFKERMFGHTKRNLFVFVLTYIGTLLRLRFGR